MTIISRALLAAACASLPLCGAKKDK